MSSSSHSKPFHHGNLRQALIDTALQVINEQGAEAVTMRGLSKAIGVSQTAAYRHFENKLDLLFAVAEEGFRTILEINQRLAAEPMTDVLETLEAFGRAYLGFALENPRLYRLMFGDEMVGEQWPKSILDVTDKAFNALMQTFARGQEQGRIREGSVFGLASVMWANMHGLAGLLIDGQLHAYAHAHGAPHLAPEIVTQAEKLTGITMDLAMETLKSGMAAVPGKPGND